MGPGRTSTVHGCLVRQEGCGWPDTTTTDKKSTAHSNMVAEQVLTYGLVVVVRERQCDDSRMRVDCAWTVPALGPDESSRVDLVTRDLDVYRIDNVVKRGCLRFWRECFRQQYIWCSGKTKEVISYMSALVSVCDEPRHGLGEDVEVVACRS